MPGVQRWRCLECIKVCQHKAALIRTNAWMDLTKAASSNSYIGTTFTESALLTTQNAGADGQAESDGDKFGPAHAVIMLVAFVIIFPLGALLLSLSRKR